MNLSDEHCDAEGAHRLKRRIEEYWAARGKLVQVKCVDGGYNGSMRSARWDVRSDLVNGLPRQSQ